MEIICGAWRKRTGLVGGGGNEECRCLTEWAGEIARGHKEEDMGEDEEEETTTKKRLKKKRKEKDSNIES